MKKILSVLLVAVATPVLAQGMKPASHPGAVALLNGSFTFVDGYITKAAEHNTQVVSPVSILGAAVAPCAQAPPADNKNKRQPNHGIRLLILLSISGKTVRAILEMRRPNSSGLCSLPIAARS